MAAKRQLSCDIDGHQLKHLDLVREVCSVPLENSCCDICHCDCYSSHRSTERKESDYKSKDKKDFKKHSKDTNNNNNCSHQIAQRTHSKKNFKARLDFSTQSLERRCLVNKSPAGTYNARKNTKLKRSKSTGNLNSSQPLFNMGKSYFTRDCDLLQGLITSLDTQRWDTKENKNKIDAELSLPKKGSKKALQLPSTSKYFLENTTWLSPKMCEPLANLCLTPSIRKAYEKVSIHDQKILNRMANKRGEMVMAKENAWLARKFWENERYERELLKCEQMDEYKRAVRDKQFQDYLLTKERLNKLALRDFQELQQLRCILNRKDALTKKRLNTIRNERDILFCQRRCEELQKSEAVNIHQEEQNLSNLLRKQEICNRLTHRLRRAHEIRNEHVQGYLNRLRYDNLIEQLVHQEHWQEVQEQEKLKQNRLKEHIEAKARGAQQFIEQRHQRHENSSKTAKISASLRELVRSSVTPEGALTLGNITNFQIRKTLI